MLSRAKAAFNFARQFTRFGASNFSAPTNEAEFLVPLIQDLRISAIQALASIFKHGMTTDQIKNYLILMDIILAATLSKALGAGNCHEQSCIIVDSYLDEGIVEPIQQYGISGDAKSEDACNEHTFVVANKSLVIDPWLNDKVLDFSSKQDKILDCCAPLALSNIKVKFCYSFDKNLTLPQWASIEKGLATILSTFLTPAEFLIIAKRNGRSDLNVIKKEFEIVRDALRKKLVRCQKHLKPNPFKQFASAQSATAAAAPESAAAPKTAAQPPKKTN